MQDLTLQQTEARIADLGITAGRQGAFAARDDAAETRYYWHSHQQHQLVFGSGGSLHVETENALWVVPPRHAAWIAAGVRHRTTLHAPGALNLYLQPEAHGPASSVATTVAPALLESMMEEAALWTDAAAPAHEAELRESFSRTLSLLCRRWFHAPQRLTLPRTHDVRIQRAIEFASSRQETVTLEQAAAAVIMSERSFRRLFLQRMRMTWRDYHVRRRLLRAMELLAQPHMRVIDAALQCGFESSSALTKSFSSYLQQSPGQYQQSLHHRR